MLVRGGKTCFYQQQEKTFGCSFTPLLKNDNSVQLENFKRTSPHYGLVYNPMDLHFQWTGHLDFTGTLELTVRRGPSARGKMMISVGSGLDWSGLVWTGLVWSEVWHKLRLRTILSATGRRRLTPLWAVRCGPSPPHLYHQGDTDHMSPMCLRHVSSLLFVSDVSPLSSLSPTCLLALQCSGGLNDIYVTEVK